MWVVIPTARNELRATIPGAALRDALGDCGGIQLAPGVLEMEYDCAARYLNKYGDIRDSLALCDPGKTLALALGKNAAALRWPSQSGDRVGVKIEAHKVNCELRIDDQSACRGNRLVSCESERGHPSKATLDRDGDAGPDTKRHGLVEEVALLPCSRGLRCTVPPAENIVFVTSPTHNGIKLLIAELKVSAGPGLWIGGNERGRLVRDLQIGEPSESEAPGHAPCDTFEPLFVVCRPDCIDELLK